MSINFNNQKILLNNSWVNNKDCIREVDKEHNPELEENTIAKLNQIITECEIGNISIEMAISELEKFDAKNFERLKTQAGQDVIRFEISELNIQ